MNKLLEEAKALNIPRENLMKADQLKQAIKDTVERYKELIFGSDVICKDCLNELKSKKKLINTHTLRSFWNRQCET